MILKKAAYFSLIVILLGSCSIRKHENNEQVLNKRKYRKGYHFQGFKTSFKKRPDAEKNEILKFKREELFTYEIEEENAISFKPITQFEAFEVKNVEAAEVEQQVKKTSSPLLAKRKEKKNEIPVLQDFEESYVPKKREKKLVTFQKQHETKVIEKKYGPASGLNSIGVSLLSNLGIKTKGDIPWLAFVIPTFVFLSSSMLFYFGVKRRRDEEEKELLGINSDAMKNTQSSAIGAESGKSSSLFTKESVAIHATVYAAIIIIGFIYLY